jgi:hypothetical protein
MKNGRAEGIVQVLILILVAGMAGAASFTHVHNWTMTNAPAGTGSWFGWANAIISELTPTAAGIEIRRRKRNHQPIGYPMAILLGAAALSLSAQVAEARPTVGGWISAAVPALAFLALTKLVLSRPSAKKGESAWNQNPDGKAASTTTGTTKPDGSKSPAEATAPPVRYAPPSLSQNAPRNGSSPNSDSNPTLNPTQTPSPASAASSDQTSASADSASTITETGAAPAELIPAPSGQLLMSARMAAFAHQQATGQHPTPGELADRMGVTPDQARIVLHHLDGITPPVTAANGTPAINGSSRP